MIEWVLVFPSFLSVFCKAMQQQNVIHRKWLAIPVTTYGIAFCEVFVITKVADLGISWSSVNGMALGGVSGCLLAMFIHAKMFKKPKYDPIPAIDAIKEFMEGKK